MDFFEATGAPRQKEWHGAPLAVLRRAFVALSISRVFGIGEETVNQLRTLFDLYFKPTPINPINLGSRRPRVPTQRRQFPGGDD